MMQDFFCVADSQAIKNEKNICPNNVFFSEKYYFCGRLTNCREL